MTALIKVPETATAGEIVEVKLLLRHPMETGFRTGRDGLLVPRDIITEVRCLVDGEEALRIELFPAITANPFIVFPLRLDGPAEITLIWTDGDGEHRETRRVAAA